MKPALNEFQEYEMTPEETLRGMIFNPEQLAYLNNMRAACARSILNQAGTKKEYDQYLEQNVHQKGQLDSLNLLLSNHELAVAELAELERSSAHE